MKPAERRISRHNDLNSLFISYISDIVSANDIETAAPMFSSILRPLFGGGGGAMLWLSIPHSKKEEEREEQKEEERKD